jgi:hypothetical protein
MTSHVCGRDFTVKTVIRVAFVLLMAATFTPAADAAGFGSQPCSSFHPVPYDNTGRGLQDTGMQGCG